MVISCAAYNCTHRFQKGSKISFHSFPSDTEVLRKWLINMKRENFRPSKFSKICSKHFEDSCFDKERFGHPYLIKGSVPTLFDFPQHMRKKVFIRKPPKPRDVVATSAPLTLSTETSTTAEPHLSTFGESVPSTSTKERLGLKRKHFMGDFEECDMSSPKKARKCLFMARNTIQAQRKRIKNLMKKNYRNKKKINSLNSLLAHLQKELMINENAAATLKASFSGPAEELFKRMTKGKNDEYSQELRSFALTLHFYSSKAYEYVRKTFNTCLPHPRTLRRWYQHIDGSPGFTKEALTALKVKAEDAEASGKSVVCSLIMDEMAIRSKIEWDGKATCGYVDMGTDVDDDSLPEAREALVLLVNAVNDCWKVPVGYFLIDTLSGEDKANLIEIALTMLHDTGIHVVSLTFDGAASNMAMAKFLGVDIHQNTTKTFFEHPVTHEPVFIFLDACHMLKLVRNSLATLGVIYNSDGGAIKWEHIVQLVEKQLEEGLTLATKVRKRHINWESEKMKVKLAAQTLSKSVSQALNYLRNTGCEAFQDSLPTADFVELFNNIFDILNSRNLLKKGYKRGFSPKTENLIKEYIHKAESYILGLKVSSPIGGSVVHSRKKTGFLGFMVCLRSCLGLYEHLVCGTCPKLKYLLLYKFSQDHLEVFFSAIRRRGGDNNNPTAAQFKAAYKRLIVHHEITGADTSNCIDLARVNILNVSSSSQPNSDLQCNAILNPSEDRIGDTVVTLQFDHDYCTHPQFEFLSPYVCDVVAYIAGFVIRKVRQYIKCETCLSAVESKNGNCQDFQFIKEKMYSVNQGLVVPSRDVITLCKLAESEIRSLGLGTKQIHQKVLCRVMRSVSTAIFEDTDDHLLDQEFAQSHQMDLIKLIVKCYVNLRMHHECAKQEENKGRKKVRSVLNKYILFQHQ